MARLWSKNPEIVGGKFLVLRRDGTQPPWPYFVLGARDPAAPHALRAYANLAATHGMDPAYVEDVRQLAREFEAYRQLHGSGDPDALPHRQDDPEIVDRMTEGCPS